MTEASSSTPGSAKRTGTGDFVVAFKDGLAEGWAFGVPEAFRDKLDIRYVQYVDRERSKELRKQQARNPDGSLPTVFRMAWTRGEPPLRSFDVGDVFYDPPGACRMTWVDALLVLHRSVQVMEARPDDVPGSGWVKIELRHHEGGMVASARNHNLSQTEFENLLRTGQLPEHEGIVVASEVALR